MDLERERALKRRRGTVRQGERLGRQRAARFRAARDDWARALGFANSEEMIRRRYLVQGATVADLAATLGCAQITVIAEMDRLGISRRSQRNRLAQGHLALAANRLRLHAARETRARELGFDDLASYLRVRHHEQR